MSLNPSEKTINRAYRYELDLIKDKLPLSERFFHCDGCNHEQDRDLNAALNLRPPVRRLLDADGKALVVDCSATKPTRLKRQPNAVKNR